MRRLAIASMCLASTAISAQQPASGTLQGAVVAFGSGEAVANATVQLRSTMAAAATVATTTDVTGKFLFPSVAAGSYRLIVTRVGYVNAEYGQPKAGAPGLPVVVKERDRLEDLRVVMTPGGVIAGHVTDRGEPVGMAGVVALKSTYYDGWRTMTPVLSTRTDDRGEYRLFWLPPGEYYVAAVVFDSLAANDLIDTLLVNPDGENNSYILQRAQPRAILNRANLSKASDKEMHVPMYFPGTSDARQASVIQINPAAQVRDVNLDVTPQPTRRVQGTLTGVLPLPGPDGTPVRPLVSLAMLDRPFPIFNQPEQILIDVDPAGPFEFPRVAPGVYALYSSQPGGNGTRINIDIRDHDLTGINLVLDQRFSINGRILIDPDTPLEVRPSLTDLRVALRADPPLPSMTSTTVPTMADGTFRIASLGANDRALRAGKYRVSVAPILMPPAVPGTVPPVVPVSLRNVYVQSIRLGTTDALNDGINLESQPQDEMIIVIGANGGTLRGRAITDAGAPFATASVVLIPEGNRRFRVNHAFTSTDADGQFQFTAVAPGAYKVFAWQDAERGKWQDPDFVRDFERFGRVVRVETGGTYEGITVGVIPPRR